MNLKINVVWSDNNFNGRYVNINTCQIEENDFSKNYHHLFSNLIIQPDQFIQANRPVIVIFNMAFSENHYYGRDRTARNGSGEYSYAY